MLKSLLLGCLILNLSCVGTKKIGNINNIVKPIIITEQESADFLVRIEFIFTPQDVEAYPELYEIFQLALAEWTKYIPIEGAIFVPKTDSVLTLVGLRDLRPNAILVNFTNNIPSEDDINYLGTWQHRTKTLTLDVADLYMPEFDSDQARAVALHELGHLFGLPHIGNVGSMDVHTGDLIVSHGAENMLMYPSVPDDADHLIISQLEATYAKNYVRSLLSPALQGF